MKHLPLFSVWFICLVWTGPSHAADSMAAFPKFCRPGSGPSISAGQADFVSLPEITARTYEFTGAAQEASGPRRLTFSYSGDAAPTVGKIVLLRRQDREYIAVRIRKTAPSDHKVSVRVLCRYDEQFEQPEANDLLTAIEKTGEIMASAPPSDLGSPPDLGPPPESLPE